MKKTIYIILSTILGVFLMTGCGSDDEKVSPSGKQIIGEWKLTSWNGAAPTEFEAYVAFNADKSFVIYQKIEKVDFQKYTGSYRIKGTTVSGVYSDKVSWGSAYEVKFDESLNSLTLTTLGTSEISIYTRTTIPSSVKDGAKAVQSVRAAEFRLL